MWLILFSLSHYNLRLVGFFLCSYLRKSVIIIKRTLLTQTNKIQNQNVYTHTFFSFELNRKSFLKNYWFWKKRKKTKQKSLLFFSSIFFFLSLFLFLFNDEKKSFIEIFAAAFLIKKKEILCFSDNVVENCRLFFFKQIKKFF